MPCLLEFLRKTLFEHIIRWEGCAILSKKKYVLEEWGAKEAVRAGGNYHRSLINYPMYVPQYLTQGCWRRLRALSSIGRDI